MANPATGAGALLALGLEQQFGIPGGGLTGYRVRLPIKAALTGAEAASGAVNQSGFIERGIPGAKGGAMEWSLPMRAGELLEFFEHLFGSVAKTTLETGVYKYTFTPTINGVDTSFYSLFSTAPVEKWWLYGIKFGSLDGEIGDNTEIPVKLQGFLGHGTRLGAAVPDDDNTGTYALGPYIRGVLKDRAAGPVHVRVTRVVGGLQFKVEQTSDSPTFAGAAVDVLLDGETLEGTWQNLQGHDGLDLGLWAENKDPLEIVWPGAAADHADLEIGDVFVFPVAWSNPAVPYLSGHQRLTSAHWLLQLRAVGAATWITKPVTSGKFSIDRAVSPDRGNNSRYPFGLIRDGMFTPSLELSRSFVDAFFTDKGERQERLEGRLQFLGRQLGASGANREGITFTYSSLRIDGDERAPANEKAIDEKLKLTGETNDEGDPPLVVEIVTTRNWTPSV